MIIPRSWPSQYITAILFTSYCILIEAQVSNEENTNLMTKSPIRKCCKNQNLFIISFFFIKDKSLLCFMLFYAYFFYYQDNIVRLIPRQIQRISSKSKKTDKVLPTVVNIFWFPYERLRDQNRSSLYWCGMIRQSNKFGMKSNSKCENPSSICFASISGQK